MSSIEWKEVYSTGMEIIDQQNKKFVQIIDELQSAQKSGTTRIIIKDILERLQEQMTDLFTFEEQIQAEYKYPLFKIHKEEHIELETKLHELKKEIYKNDILLGMRTLDLLRDWTINHILGSDKEFALYLEKLEVIMPDEIEPSTTEVPRKTLSWI